jgi:hypothetical protein
MVIKLLIIIHFLITNSHKVHIIELECVKKVSVLSKSVSFEKGFLSTLIGQIQEAALRKKWINA